MKCNIHAGCPPISLMKPQYSHKPTSPWAALTAVAFALGGPLSASPQLVPTGSTEVADFIQTDVSADPGLKGAEVNVRVENGIAVLSGAALSLSQAERATARAIASAGVRAVVNKIAIPTGASSEITEQIRAAFKAQKMVSAEDIKPTVNGSKVTLSGSVGTLDERDLAREIVTQIPGVVAIQNNLEVTFEGIRKDSQIEEQLRFIIKDDPLYAGLDLKVAVKSGVAKISGDVGTKGEHDRLIRNSYVTGVIDVQIGDLSIDRNLAMEGLGDKEYSEEETLSALRDALVMDSRIEANGIQPFLQDGMLTLKGSVRSPQEKDLAETTARAVPGVAHVTNLLKAGGDAPALASTTRNLKLASPPVLKRSR